MENFAKMLDNIIKGPIMSLLGVILMIASMVLWFYEYLSDAQAIFFGVLGIVFLFMKDEIVGLVRAYIKKKMGIESKPPTDNNVPK